MERIDLNNYEAFLLDYSEGTLNAADIAALKAFVMAHPKLKISLDEETLPVVFEERLTFDFKNELKKSESLIQEEEILNYIEGNLSPEAGAAFEKRAAVDKALAAELASYRKTILVAEAGSFENKAALKKTEDDLALNNIVIAYVEGQLPAAEKAAFEQALKADQALEKELAFVLKTKLQADAGIIYPDKKTLKKKNRIIALFDLRTVGAMAAAILLLFGLVVVFNHYNASPAARQEIAIKHSHKNAIENKTGTSKALATNKVAQVAGASTVSATPAEDQPVNTSKRAPAVQRQDTKMPSAAVAQQREKTVPVVPKSSESPMPVLPENSVTTAKPDSYAMANRTDALGHDYLTIVETAAEEEAPATAAAAKQKNSFWKRAVKVARQANKLGVKAVDGEEKPNNAFYLSFSAFSVEKK